VRKLIDRIVTEITEQKEVGIQPLTFLVLSVIFILAVLLVFHQRPPYVW
jgi:hypothetical protein